MAFGWESYLSRMAVDGKLVTDPRRKELAEWAAEVGYGEWSEDAVRRTFEAWSKGSYKTPY